ncbi:diacylglycerol kinase family protein [Niabella sp. CC-SYL272]|uniref:diacylglycerol kinase family protein n=1 Tax=Niabella agricola TaxID=2891571 RepID=UPI001F1BA764|nr:diacylglycerol kinase family protein [Niabella agricola]MCF3109358.1 diacylglycerol kinase family protein [Niabella agricola]
MKRPFSLNKLLRSFGYAVRGIKTAFRFEQNFRIHAVATLLAVLLAFVFRITVYEWLVIILCISVVTGAELINTSIEKICDLVHPQTDSRVQYIKDISAAAVLLTAAGALIAGLLIFVPRLVALI